jgi:hypothetical protein
MEIGAFTTAESATAEQPNEPLPSVPIGRQPITGNVIDYAFHVLSGDYGDRPFMGVTGSSTHFDALRLNSCD